MIIGVTGLPCAGKSLAASLLARGGVAGVPAGELLKADDVGHDVLERPEVRERLLGRFGDGIAAPEPAETRRRIAARVFADPAELAWLERLLHPLISREIGKRAEAAADRHPLVIEAALLTVAGLDRRCDVVVLIEADFATRLRRAEKRGWDRRELERRDARQLPLFAAEKLHELGDKLILVRNDRDDNRLAESLGRAWAEHNREKQAGTKGISDE